MNATPLSTRRRADDGEGGDGTVLGRAQGVRLLAFVNTREGPTRSSFRRFRAGGALRMPEVAPTLIVENDPAAVERELWGGDLPALPAGDRWARGGTRASACCAVWTCHGR